MWTIGNQFISGWFKMLCSDNTEHLCRKRERFWVLCGPTVYVLKFLKWPICSKNLANWLQLYRFYFILWSFFMIVSIHCLALNVLSTLHNWLHSMSFVECLAWVVPLVALSEWFVEFALFSSHYYLFRHYFFYFFFCFDVAFNFSYTNRLIAIWIIDN